uniref:Doublecortin domain containing 2C n=1 Tax=Crocodylus porosus TaxID=8502 RepID=A0A7M4EMB5_CROPO
EAGRGSKAPVLMDVAPARTVLVYRNGDPHYQARRVVLHRRRVPTLDALLLQLDEAVAPPFGVRALYTPRSGRLVRRLDELQPGACYVAAGPEPLGNNACFLFFLFFFFQVKPVVHSAIRVPSRWQLFYNKPRNINVFTNGEILVPPAKFLIPRFTLRNWDSVLALLNEKIFPRSGGVQRLYTLDGHAVYGSDKLEDNHYYVAGGKEKFKHLPYWCSPRVPPEANVVPIFKKGRKVDPANYRPIGLTSVPGKILEKLIKEAIVMDWPMPTSGGIASMDLLRVGLASPISFPSTTR